MIKGKEINEKILIEKYHETGTSQNWTLFFA